MLFSKQIPIFIWTVSIFLCLPLLTLKRWNIHYSWLLVFPFCPLHILFVLLKSFQFLVQTDIIFIWLLFFLFFFFFALYIREMCRRNIALLCCTNKTYLIHAVHYCKLHPIFRYSLFFNALCCTLQTKFSLRCISFKNLHGWFQQFGCFCCSVESLHQIVRIHARSQQIEQNDGLCVLYIVWLHQLNKF